MGNLPSDLGTPKPLLPKEKEENAARALNPNRKASLKPKRRKRTKQTIPLPSLTTGAGLRLPGDPARNARLNGTGHLPNTAAPQPTMKRRNRRWPTAFPAASPSNRTRVPADRTKHRIIRSKARADISSQAVAARCARRGGRWFLSQSNWACTGVRCTAIRIDHGLQGIYLPTLGRCLAAGVPGRSGKIRSRKRRIRSRDIDHSTTETFPARYILRRLQRAIYVFSAPPRRNTSVTILSRTPI